MFEDVVREIKQIDFNKLKEGKSIETHLSNHQFEKAFYLVCMHCGMDDYEGLRLIKILLFHRHDLGIDLSLKQHGRSALRLAADNGNINLYYELTSGGAVDEEADRIMARKQRKAIASFEQHYHPEFLHDSEYLRKEVIGHDTSDLKRIDYLLKLIDFLLKYKDIHSRFKKMPKKLSDLAVQTIKDARDSQNRVLISKMCAVIQQLSPDVKRQFDKVLETSSLNWLIFEHLGGIMIEPSMQKVASVLFNRKTIDELGQEKSKQLVDSAFALIAEAGDLQLIIPRAVLTIIEKDLPSLKNFFHMIYMRLVSPDKQVIVSKPELAVSKCLITYINDIHTLIRLLNLSQDSTARMKIPVWSDPGAPHINLLNLNPNFDTAKKVELHAALRRLQSLGELITGKNFSRFLIDLDPGTDWRAFIVIRDALTHQDEKDLKYRIGQFLNNNVWLQQVFVNDLEELGKKLNHLIWLREQSLGTYNHDPEFFWQKLLKQEAASSQKGSDASNNNNTGKQEADLKDQAVPPRHVMSASEKEFILYLEKFKAPPDMIELCLTIFAGQAGVVSKKQKGMILQCLPRKEMGEKYKELSSLLDRTIAKPSLTLAEREQKRLDEKEACEKREVEREAKFQGLDGIRKLAKYLLEPVKKEHQLNPLKRIEAAIESLSDIEEFLIQEGFWMAPSPFNTTDEWQKCYQQGSKTLSSRLVSNSKLNDALEYNIGQILQHLETLKTYKKMALCPLIANSYADLRAFRNYLEHGNPLVDNQNDIYLQQDYREKKTADMVIRLLIELRPFLYQEKMRIETEKANARELHPGVMVTAKEAEEWTMLCGRSNRFFNPLGKTLEKSQSNVARFELPGDSASPRSSK
ncbi:hypothetical protein GH742_08205 [Legionella sp. MW5194]|nr:hypothetical protein GH742_08205 [Legionella sp. MW5194]